MYLLSPDQIKSALGAAGCSRIGGSDMDLYKSALGAVLTRVEGLLEVQTISRKEHTDYFEIDFNYTRRVKLHLNNAFITEAGVVLKQGDVVLPVSRVDRELGHVILGSLPKGSYTVTYESGFEVDSDKVFVDVPEKITSLALACIALWYRTGVLSVKVPENVSFGPFIRSTVRELFTRAYTSFDRRDSLAILPDN